MSNRAKQAIQELLQTLNITTVVNIDDVYAQSTGISEVIGIVYEVKTTNLDSLKKIFVSLDINWDASEKDVWIRQLREGWENLRVDQQQEVYTELAKLTDTQWIKDLSVSKRLEKAFPRKINLLPLSPSQWLKEKDKLLKQTSEHERMLCLFDQDLSSEEGFGSEGPRSGIGLLRELLESGTSEHVICGVLTHKISSIENEMPRWRTLAAEENLPLSKFLPLAKVRLSDEENPLVFADGLKKTCLNLYCEQIKDESVKIIQEASDSAAAQLCEIDVYDFDHMVMKSSAKEGVREVDTILRLFHIFQHDSVKNALLKHDVLERFSSYIQISRPISQIETQKTELTQASQLRRQELYEDADVVKNTPLNVGDIFASTHTSTRYILLAQPCDLMVRQKEGSRTITDLAVPLVPITDILPSEDAKKKESGYWRTHAVLPYFDNNSNNLSVLTFKQTYWLNVDILDLVVLNADDECYINLSQKHQIPIHLPIGWHKHLLSLIERFTSIASRLNEIQKKLRDSALNPEDQDIIWKSVIPTFATSPQQLPPDIYTNNIFNFKLRRVGRYREPDASRLLKAFSQYLARDAEEHDFALPIE